MALIHGIDRDSALAAAMTATGTIVPQSGIPVNAAGELRTTVIAGAPPAGSVLRQGVSYASDGTLQVTLDAIGQVVNGVAYTLAGVVCHTVGAPSNNSPRAYIPGIGMVLVDTTGRLHVS